MKKIKIFSLLLACVTVLAVGIAVFAFAADYPSLNGAASATVKQLAANMTVSGFDDVDSADWYADAVAYCSDNGIMNGTTGTTFSPLASMSRAMLAAVLYRTAGSPGVAGSSFMDVKAGEWYSDAVAWASSSGIISGYGNNLFGTNDPVTREQIAAILWRYEGSPALSGTADRFSDAGAISSWAAGGVSWVQQNGIMSGRPGNVFDPKANATRAEVAVILQRYLTLGAAEPSTGSTGTLPIVYMTTDISSEGLMAVYKALGVTPKGNVAVKLHTGESKYSNYLRPELIADLVQSLNATIVECNTAYGGSRASTAYHLQLAEDHGFTAIAPVDIMDADGSLTLPVTGGTHLTENYVGSHFTNYDYFVILSHFKGHEMAGFGGAIKNAAVGIASSNGKLWIHSAGNGFGIGAMTDDFLESMAEAAKSVSDYMGGKILYINVMNRLSIDCDCIAYPAEPDMHDIGILASFDPVALDEACVDLVYNAPDGHSLIEIIESLNGFHTLVYAEEIGLGSREYTLVRIDD